MLLSVRVWDGWKLDCWESGGRHLHVVPPCYPHFYSLYPRDLSTPVQRRLLSNISKVVDLWRIDVDNTYDIRNMRDAESIEADIPWVQLLVLLYGFEHENQVLDHASFDIEMISEGQFPNFTRIPIDTLSWFSPHREEVLQGSEESILEGFADIVRRDNPDVLDTYAGPRFDWRAVLARAAVLKVPMPLGRARDAPKVVIAEKEYGKFKGYEYTCYMDGRLSFDVWRETRQDTVFTGKVKNRQLKTVARFMFPDERFIEVDRTRLGNLTQSERRDYCLSDARATWMLAEHYLHILKFMATDIGLPMDLVFRREPSHVGNYLYGQEFKKLNVVSDGSNYDRFRGVLWE